MRLLLSIPLLLLLLAAPARAGTYVDTGLDGWSPVIRAPGGFVAAGRGSSTLGVQFWGRAAFAPGDRAAWAYDAPPDTSVTAWAFEREVAGIGSGHWNTLFSAGRHLVAHDVPSANRVWGRIAAGGLAAGRLDAALQCGGPRACAPVGVARLTLRASRVSLHDPYAPVVSVVQGELVTAPVLRGSVALSFAAADRGGGVHRAFAVVDGRAAAPVAVGDERCRALAPHVFAHRRPCPLEAGATVAIDTARLSEGRHEVAVVVEDAAGNRTTAYGPVAKTVDNVPPAPRPAVAPRPLVVSAWLDRRGRRALSVTTRYGERVRLRGRVTDIAGRPLAGAPVDVAEQVVDAAGQPVDVVGGRSASWRPAAALRTFADGTFTAFTRVGPSRRIRVAGAPLALTVNVRAPVTARVRGAIVSGRLRGGRRGVLVELQARRGRRWVTRLVVRTFASGRFSGRLRARGRVRARVPAQPGLPYTTGVSPPRRARRTGPGTSR
jgi:hypothetical protein